MSIYSVNEIFYSLQGEGAQSGRPAVFCRFAGCNLWSGREEDRAAAVCRFCDTQFVGADGPDGGRFHSPLSLAAVIAAHWPPGAACRFVVLTGGEPTLQVDLALIKALHDEGFEIAIETNGTKRVPQGIDWICVSPKAGAQLIQRSGAELKLVYPQEGLLPDMLPPCDFKNYYLQPMDGQAIEANTKAAVRYCKSNPHWRLSLQSHKLLGLR